MSCLPRACMAALALGLIGAGSLDAGPMTADTDRPGAGSIAGVADRLLDTVFTDETAARMPAIEDWSTDADFADVDGDGDLDILVSNYYIGIVVPNLLLLNDGDGHFVRDSTGALPTPYAEANYIATGDIERDGDLDINVSSSRSVNLLLVNNGSGRFAIENNRLPYYYDPWVSNGEPQFVDVDSDLDLDYLVVNWQRRDWMGLNDGLGFFTARDSRFGSGSDTGTGQAAADVDGDFDADVFVTNYSRSNKLMINDGSGRFTDETDDYLPDGALYTRRLVLGDVDGDGDLDLLECNRVRGLAGGEQNRLFINHGTPDSIPPAIPRTSIHADTKDTLNPYLVATEVWDNISVNSGELKVTLQYRSLRGTAHPMVEGRFLGVRMLECGGVPLAGRDPGPTGRPAGGVLRPGNRPDGQRRVRSPGGARLGVYFPGEREAGEG